MSTTPRRPQVGHVIEAEVTPPGGGPKKRRRLLVVKETSNISGADFDAVGMSTKDPSDEGYDYCVLVPKDLCKRAKTTENSYVKCFWIRHLKLTDILSDDWGFISNNTIMNAVKQAYDEAVKLPLAKRESF